jgi:transglutaminase-like putative cysteine protease
MQVLIGSVMSQSDQIGLWLLAWAMLALWVLGQFFLQREAVRFHAAFGLAERAGPPAPALDPYRGLFDLPYAVATARVLVTTLALGGLIFLALPRQAGATRQQPGPPPARHLTGFDEEVALGQFGEILENDSVVMTVEFTDADGKTIDPPPEPLWRGITYLRYERGRWGRPAQRPQQTVVAMSERNRKLPKVIHQKIKLEPNDLPTLFAIRPIREFNAGLPHSPSLNPIDGTLFRPSGRSGAYDYEVYSDPNPNAAQPEEQVPDVGGRQSLLSITPALKTRLRKIAEPVVASIPVTGRAGVEAKARALESYLRDSGLFTYSLHMEVIDSKLDPVDDFLTNRKEGHCEYFASALALLLRSIDIPARMVSGFKGGDWSELTQTMNVRQKHAHSWVEVYLGVGPDVQPIWITLDPTPGAERARSIAQVGGFGRNFRTLSDLLRYIWVFYIVGYDGERQDRLLYSPMRQMSNWVRERAFEVARFVRKGFAALFHFRNISDLFSVPFFAVSLLMLALATGTAFLALRLGQRIFRWIKGPAIDSASLTAGIVFYRRLTQLLAELDLERTPAETQGEFAVRASKFLHGHAPATQTVAEVPQQVVDAFYRVRFGHLDLEKASLDALEARLDALESSLKPNDR